MLCCYQSSDYIFYLFLVSSLFILLFFFSFFVAFFYMLFFFSFFFRLPVGFVFAGYLFSLVRPGCSSLASSSSARTPVVGTYVFFLQRAPFGLLVIYILCQFMVTSTRYYVLCFSLSFYSCFLIWFVPGIVLCYRFDILYFLECVCRACRIQCDYMALHCMVYCPYCIHHSAVSLWPCNSLYLSIKN